VAIAVGVRLVNSSLPRPPPPSIVLVYFYFFPAKELASVLYIWNGGWNRSFHIFNRRCRIHFGATFLYNF
jgi:hypothetical protein